MTTCLAVAFVALAPSEPVAAHTDFESSVPAAGDVVDAPVETVTLTFTATATPAGDEFLARNGDGSVQTPVSVAVDDDRIFTLTFAPALAGGEVALRYTVAGADGHPFSGAVVFTVTASPTTAPPTTGEPSTDPDAGSASADDAAGDESTVVAPAPSAPAAGADVAAGADATDAAAAIDETSTASSAVDETSTGSSADPTQAASSADEQPSGDTIALDEFLAEAASTPGEGRELGGRLLSAVGLVIAFGVAVFAFAVMTGRSSEYRMLAVVVRGLGVVAAIGAAIEYVGVARRIGQPLAMTWDDADGAPSALRLAAALLVIAGAAALVPHRRTAPLSAAPAAPTPTASPPEVQRPLDTGDADATSGPLPIAQRWMIVVGAAFALISYWFDGHTVTEGPRVVHAAANSLHLVAAAVWAGGVVAMAAVAWMRHRRGRPTGAGRLVLRFSALATLALVAVVVGGVVMATMILDGPGDLTSTSWGRTLLVKLGAVAVAAALGAYNHFVLRPRFAALPATGSDTSASASDRSPAVSLERTLRTTLTLEAAVLVAVTAVSAWLVGAAI